MRPLREYLFVDRRRVNAYFDQIKLGQNRLHVEKASAWSMSLALLELGAKGTEALSFRDPTIIEKLDEVERFIREHFLALENEERDFVAGEFVNVECDAHRTVINASASARTVAMWLSTDESSAALGRRWLLLENDQEADAEPELSYYNRLSPYSLLGQIALVAMLALREKLVVNALDRFEEGNQLNPFEFLDTLGANPLPARRIRALCRVRGVTYHSMPSLNADHGAKCDGVAAYPIFVEEA